tara:strand:- start:366 stop:653 length:288 start_codon:yes stop_codon:yes gene_type:complete
MTKGDEKWIKNWKPKGVKMKPSKTKPAKRNANPILSKLLNLKYRINEWREEHGNSNNTKTHRNMIFELINKAKYDGIISKEDMKIANTIWKLYER